MPRSRIALAGAACLAALAWLCAAPLAAAFGPKADLVKVDVFNAWEACPQGRTMPLALRLSVEPGWHINSDKPADPSFIPTKLKVSTPKGAKASAPAFPKPKMLNLASLGKPAPVFGGVFWVRLGLSAAKGLKPGQYEATCVLSFQGCNDQMCLMPQEMVFKIPFKVAPGDEPVRKINLKAFEGS